MAAREPLEPRPGDLASLSSRHAGAVVLVCLALLFLSVHLAAHRLGFQTDPARLLSVGDPVRRSMEELSREFPNPQDLVVVIDGGSAPVRQEAIRDLTGWLEREPGDFRQPLGGLYLPALREGALGYLDQARVVELASEISTLRPLALALSESQDLTEVLARCRHLLGQSGPGTSERAAALEALLDRVLQRLQGRPDPSWRSPWERLLDGLVPHIPLGTLDLKTLTLYQTRDGGRKHLLLVAPASADWQAVRRSAARLEEILDQARARYPDLRFRVTGEGLLMLDEMETAIRDSVRSALLAVVGVGGLIVLGFAEVRRPMLVMLSALLAMGWNLGLVSWLPGHLNVVTVWVNTLVVVLAADLGIHLLYRYEEERCKGLADEEAMRVSLAQTGLENKVGCLAAAGAFAPLLLSDLACLRELALVAATGTAMAWLATSTALPSMLLLQERSRHPSRIRHHEDRDLIRAERWALKSPWTTVLLFALVTGALLVCSGPIPVASNLLEMQDPDLDSVRTARSLGTRSTLPALCLAPDLEALSRLVTRLEALPSVERVESLAPLFPEDLPAKASRVRRIRSDVEGLSLPRLRPLRGLEDLERAEGELQALAQTVNRALPGWDSSSPMAELHATLQSLEAVLRDSGPGPVEDALEFTRLEVTRDFQATLGLLQAQKVPPPPRLEALPQALLSRTVGRSGRILVRVYPREELDQTDSVRRFLADLRRVDPQVTGAPVLMERLTAGTSEALFQATRMAALLLGLLLLVCLRSLHRSLRALLPAGMGLVGGVAVLSHLGEPWTPINLLALPLTLALGVVLGTHVVERFIHHPGEGLFAVSTGPAVAISALTTSCGLVTLAGSAHQGIASLGLALAAGLVLATLGALLLLPALIKIMRRSRIRA